ncbi:MAG: tetratricopeptide repeat protein [Methylotenera sp.]|uniref:tetratricopeptide repeat protein n=1 Tax=Methylotenera sp. TaxID=2051956 RepID=UPI002488D417|nr:tetratricopeptide repeat protein [Methylotenera sp.]MDI1308077.1 tetratricopeptide repeat protein [Methylotenera sp.]
MPRTEGISSSDLRKRVVRALAQIEASTVENNNDLGTMMFSEGNLEDAVFLLENAVKRAPDPVVPLSNLIETYCAANQPDMALFNLAQLSRHVPKSQDKIVAIRSCMEALLSAEQGSEYEHDVSLSMSA